MKDVFGLVVLIGILTGFVVMVEWITSAADRNRARYEQCLKSGHDWLNTIGGGVCVRKGSIVIGLGGKE